MIVDRLTKYHPRVFLLACLIIIGCFGVASSSHAAYITEATLTSTDLLTGETGMQRVISFQYDVSALPAGTSLAIQFSFDNSTWYDSDAEADASTALLSGDNTINFTGTKWLYAEEFYYRIVFTSDGDDTPVLDSIQINFDGEVGVSYNYVESGTLVSTNLLAAEDVYSIDSFNYTAPSIPANTGLTVQFSQDNATWYDSAGIEDGTDTLGEGSASIDISGLSWSGSNFYYKIAFTSDSISTPVLDLVSVGFTGYTTVSGTVYSDEGSTPLTSQSVRLAVNGTDLATATSDASDGTYSISLAESAISTGDVLTLYLEDETADAVTVTVAAGATASGMDLYQNRLVARQDNGGSLTNSNLSAAAVAGENDISNIYSVTAGALTVADGKELFIWTGDTFAPGGAVTVDDIDINGSLTLGSNGAAVSGSWDATGGTFTSSGTVTFDSTASEVIVSNSNSFNTLVFNGSGGSWTLSDALDVNAAFTITAGTVVDGGNSIDVAGNWSNAGTYTGTGTVTFSGAGSQTLTSGGSAFYNFILNGSGGTYTLQDSLAVETNLTITAGKLVDGSNGITLTGNWSNAGFYTGTGTVTFDKSSGTQTIVSGGSGANQDFTNVIKSGGGTLQFVTNGVDIDGTLTISADTIVDLNGQNLTSLATLVNNGTLLLEGGETVGITAKDTDSGLVKYDGSGSYLTELAYGNTYYDLEFDRAGAVWEPDGAVTINNALTITSGTFDIDGQDITVTGTYSNGGTLRLLGSETVSLTNDTNSGTVSYDNAVTLSDFPANLYDEYYNLSLNGSGTVQLAAALDVDNDITVGAGATLDFNGFNITVGGNFTNSGTLQNVAARTITLDGTNQTFNPASISFATLLLSGSSGTVTLGSNFTLTTLLQVAANRAVSLGSYIINLLSGSITNSGTITEDGSGYVQKNATNFYIADSNFDEDAAISMGVDKVYITVVDEDSNKDGTTPDTISDAVIVACTNDEETLSLTETGNATELFRYTTGLTVGLYDGSATNDDGTLECTNGETITATFTDPQDSDDTKEDTSVATTDTIPTAPSGFSGAADSESAITWTWTDNSSTETGFRLYNAANNALIATIATPNTSSYQETSLTDDTTYSRYIVAYNTAGNSTASASDSVTTDAIVTAPTTPGSFAGSAASPTSITWTWTDTSSNEVSFLLADGSDTLLATIRSATVAGTGSTVSYTETGLSANTAYTRKIAATNADGTSSYTGTVQVTTDTNASPASFSMLYPAEGALLAERLPAFSFNKSIDSDGTISSYVVHIDNFSFTINSTGPTQRDNRFTSQYLMSTTATRIMIQSFLR